MPVAELSFDSEGNLYGTAENGGNYTVSAHTSVQDPGPAGVEWFLS